MPQPTKARTAREKLILALDVPSLDEAIGIVKELKDEVGLFKIGLELYAHGGTLLFEAMRAEGVPFFFDCKFHDIPNTVARASQALVGQGIAMFNVHATGGFEMMQATAKATHKAAQEANVAVPKIISVTMLTSISDKEASEIGFGSTVSQLVPQLALLTQRAGLDGVVASAQEVQAIRQACGPDFFIVTPGIRPAWSSSDDQKRIVTPAQAIKDGADYLVVGRPITQASSRRDAARRVVEENGINQLKKLALLLAFLLIAMLTPAFAAEERPVNFIFLIDVSGSMVLKSTMVTAADGTQVTLFEALRQALKQVAEDPRLINPKSRISFITFGTKITEKTDWPSKLETAEDRQSLLKVIQSPDALNADKHGDTYMGGALALALQKANQMYSDADPCTTTFIVMLTDGWDEPPAGATVKVRNVASELTKKQSEILKKVGIKTWKVLVIGLQRLPDKKAGTTTAKELADMLGGGFIDVTKQAGGAVSERIFLALKSQVEQLKGQLTLGEGKSLKNGIVDFGTVVGNGSAKASFPLQLKSCYAEEIAGVKDVTSTVQSSKLKALLGTAASITGGACQSVTTIPADAITLHVAPTQIAPSGEPGNRSLSSQEITIDAQAHTNCPAGHYAGCFKLDSSAKVPEYIGWTLRVPGRVVAYPEALKVKVRKPGFLWAEDSDVDLIGKIKELPGAHAQANYDVEILPQRATMVSSKKGDATDARSIAQEEINGGKPLSFALDTAKADNHEFKLNVAIKANQAPGKYAGVLAVHISGPAETVAPNEIPFEITVEPSAWEEIAPLAIPILFVLVLLSVFGLFLWITNMKRD